MLYSRYDLRDGERVWVETSSAKCLGIVRGCQLNPSGEVLHWLIDVNDLSVVGGITVEDLTGVLGGSLFWKVHPLSITKMLSEQIASAFGEDAREPCPYYFCNDDGHEL